MKKRIKYRRTIGEFLAIFLLMAILSLSLPTVGLSALVWSASKTPLKFVGPNAMAPTDQNTIYAGTADLPILGTHNGNGMWKTTNGGTNWVQINDANLPTTWWEFAIAVDPTTSNTVYVSPQTTGSSNQTIGQGVYKTTNGGTNWFPTNTGLPTPNTSQCNVSSIAVDENTGAIYAGTIDLSLSFNHQGIFKSTNEGAEWYPINTGIATDNLGVVYVTTTPATNNIYCTVAGVPIYNKEARVYKSTDGGDNWFNVTGDFPTTWPSALIIYLRLGEKAESDSTLYLSAFPYPSGVSGEGLYKTTNSGTNWVKIKDGSYGSAYLVPSNPNDIYIGGECTESAVHKVGCFHSTNTGASWFLENDGLPTPNPAVAFMSMNNDGSKIFASVRKDPGSNPDGNDADGIYKGILPSYPTGWIKINNGAATTNDRNVTLTLYATDNLGTTTGVCSMAISNDNFASGTNWESYTTSKPWQLTSGDGTKTVSVKYKDYDGETSPVYQASIILSTDSTKPTGTIKINNGDEVCHKTQVTLNLSATDTGSGVAKMAISNNNFASGTNWENYATSKTWNLTTGDGLKTVYVKYKDNNGNISVVYSASINLVTGKLIKRLAGNDRYLTAIEIAKEGWKTGAQTVVIARADLFPDALAGASLAKAKNAPILLTTSTALYGPTSDEITTLGAKKAYILGGEGAISAQVVDDLKSKHSMTDADITRLGGANRYETAAIIGGELASPANKTAIIATGENYPDALASGSLAAYLGMPIVLVGKDSVPSKAEDLLKNLKISKTIIVGGEGVVSSTVESWLTSNGYNPQRLAGLDRYGTAKAIIDYALANGLQADYITVATGENFPDALASGPMAAFKKAPILLVRKTSIPDDIKGLIEKYKDNIYIVYITGGEGAVSADVQAEIASIIGAQ